MTEKLYYQNAYISTFEANVVDFTPTDKGYDVILDKTAFFPEEGGQSSDTGYIGDARVSYVYEKDGVIHHITDKCPSLGEKNCVLDFADRFEKMQCHTAEHILCGIIHRLFGLDNVGFHLGEDEVTFDVNGVLTRADLDRVEIIANNAVFSNWPIETFFPSADELSKIEYRSKLEITEGVRLVKIAAIDTCACCAPHVAFTGEIGLIKILDFMKHRGGTRIWMVAGHRALSDYRARYENIKRISGMLSAPQLETADVLETYVSESEEIKASLKQARLKIAELEAQSVLETDGSAVFYFPDFTIPELIAFSNVANKKVGKITVALSGTEGDYKYVISSESVDLKSSAKSINGALSGRGGGKPNMIQGSFSATLEEIKRYFEI
ncbi:MAG: alanyl-tRNA editing protein [Clostridia bacterium]|nr:alanyl-tRNA editing protein [Clostridia bacterium]